MFRLHVQLTQQSISLVFPSIRSPRNITKTLWLRQIREAQPSGWASQMCLVNPSSLLVAVVPALSPSLSSQELANWKRCLLNGGSWLWGKPRQSWLCSAQISSFHDSWVPDFAVSLVLYSWLRAFISNFFFLLVLLYVLWLFSFFETSLALHRPWPSPCESIGVLLTLLKMHFPCPPEEGEGLWSPDAESLTWTRLLCGTDICPIRAAEWPFIFLYRDFVACKR